MRFLTAVLVAAMVVISCSGGGSNLPTLPEESTGKGHSQGACHYMWGLWQFTADPAAGTLDAAQLRTGNFHLNALPFLEPPPLVNLTLESLKFVGNKIEADIGLRHPFLGLTEFTGFDVCGILITNGSVTGFTDAGIIMAGKGDTRLLNPDGYSRWWNPAEFPHTATMFGYKDGLLGAPYSYGQYNSTVNGYKYFCDDLKNPGDSLTKVTLEKRGMFSAGQKNIRHYTIELGAEGLVFNYAVDASWQFPNGSAPWKAPDDFGPGANRREAWRISTSAVENTLWNDGVENGGDLKLMVDVYDWFDAGLNTVRVESQGNFPMTESASPIGGGAGYSTYEIEILDATPAAGEISLFISIISEEADFGSYIPGINTTVYFIRAVSVSPEKPILYHWEFDTIATFAGLYFYTPLTTEFDDISPALIEESDGDIALTWAGTDTNEVFNGLDSIFWVRRSVDNGVTYGFEKYGDSASETLYRTDRNKVAAGAMADAYAASSFVTSGSYITRVEDGHPNWAVFVSYPTRDLELFVDADGYIYNFNDSGINISMKHSSAPNTLAPSSWSTYTAYTVATAAYVSHVRSVGMDSSDVVWLAYYNNTESQIKLAYSTDASPHESWDSSTVVYAAGSGITQVKNPSLWIDGSDVFHICFTRYYTSTGTHELVYTKDDSKFDNPEVLVVVQSPTPINDAHISIGWKFGHEVAVFIYETGKSIYLMTLIDGDPLGIPIEIDENTDDIDPDVILDADECDLHAVWSTMDGVNYDIARRNAVLVED